jgi:hypothetical protein
MERQLNIQFPETPKTPMEEHMETMADAQKKYGTTKPLVLGENNQWYIEGFGGKMIEASEWKRLNDELYSVDKNERRDIN